MNRPVYFASFICAFCGIAYELLLGSYATFLIGASIFQYSLVFSSMMASMGAGSLLSGKIKANPINLIVFTEILLATLAILALPIFYFCFIKDVLPYLVLLFFVISIGILIGMEIPILNEIAKNRLANILFFDYIGGFIGGLFFPLLILPRLGFFKVAAILSILNSIAALIIVLYLHSTLKRKLYVFTAVILFFGIFYYFIGDKLRIYLEHTLIGINL